MKVRISRIDKTLPLPEYHTKGAAGLDLYARETIEVNPGEVKLIPSNIIIDIPSGWMFMLAARSSLARKKGLMLGNGIGIIDSDYSGPEDEIKIQVYNFRDEAVVIEKGERIAQGVFVRVDQAELEEIENMDGESRGGFGSTG